MLLLAFIQCLVQTVSASADRSQGLMQHEDSVQTGLGRLQSVFYLRCGVTWRSAHGHARHSGLACTH